MLSKVPEVTIWFWIIKILCTTVGESFADWINSALGVGLLNTALIFTAVMAVVLWAQLRLRAYAPGIYWLAVVVLSITGTLYTDILTDALGVPLWVSSAVFAVLLAAVFGIWWSRERTLSIHSIDTRPREAFYWVAVLVTFALGTALGDWTLELTGWGPGASILLPAGLIAIVTILWRFGADPVLSFWIAYILTRPLGANIGDFLALPTSQQGLGLGTMLTSVMFLGAILLTVIYLSISKADVIGRKDTYSALATDVAPAPPATSPSRRRGTLAALALVGAATVALLVFTSAQPHQSALAAEGPGPSCAAGSTPLTGAAAAAAVKSKFPAENVSHYRDIAKGMLASVGSGDAKGVSAGADELEKSWDADQDSLNSADCQAWTYVDQQIDPVLKSARAATPDSATEQKALTDLLATLGA